MKHTLVLASRSPRRIELLKTAGFTFNVRASDIDETPPAEMPAKKVPAYLAKEKAKATTIAKKEMIIAADTIVVLNNTIFGKPKDMADAKRILNNLSDNMHTVITGVCTMTTEKNITFSEQTKVFFRKLTDAEIDHYIKKYKPFDKAGAYAIQEWIGLTGIYRIEGDYFNVMGLPMCRLIEEMNKF